MPIPDFQAVMLPLLETLADGRVWTMREATERLAKRFKLTETELSQMLPSGHAPLFYNRVAWAKTHMKVAGLINNPVEISIAADQSIHFFQFRRDKI